MGCLHCELVKIKSAVQYICNTFFSEEERRARLATEDKSSSCSADGYIYNSKRATHRMISEHIYHQS